MVKKQKQEIGDHIIPILFFDGASRGNPGKAAGAAVIIMPDGDRHTAAEFLPFATNNVAEYTGLIVGLKKAAALGIRKLEIRGDSNLVVKQVQDFWKVKAEHLQPLYQEAKRLIQNFDHTRIEWVAREQNKLADAAANKCIDGGKTKKNKPVKEKIEQPTKIPHCDYTIGDVIVIGKSQQQGIIIDEPKLLANGKWLLSIEVAG